MAPLASASRPSNALVWTPGRALGFGSIAYAERFEWMRLSTWVF